MGDISSIPIPTYPRGTTISGWCAFGDGRARPFIAAEGNQTFAQFSPDGRWLAYDSNETGSSEVYVDAVPQGRE